GALALHRRGEALARLTAIPAFAVAGRWRDGTAVEPGRARFVQAKRRPALELGLAAGDPYAMTVQQALDGCVARARRDDDLDRPARCDDDARPADAARDTDDGGRSHG